MNILIIDDEPLVRRSLEKSCQLRGHKTYLACDGKEGYEKWTSIHPDLVFLDVMMPELSGPDLLAKMRDANLVGTTKVVLISAYAGDAATNLADLFIQKPFEDIFKVIEEAEGLVK